MNEHRFAGWNPFDDSHISEIEKVFEPDDCTMYNENYGICHDYPCDDCKKTLKNSGELDERNI